MASPDSMSAPPPLDLSHHLSHSAKKRTANILKSMYKYMLIPGIGSAAGGLPNKKYFPFDTLAAQVAPKDRWKPTPNDDIDPPPAAAGSMTRPQPQSNSIAVPTASAEQNPLKKIDVETALQYGTAQGYPPLYYFLRQWTRNHLHPNVPYKGGPEIIMTCGNTDGFSKVLYALTEEWNDSKDPVEERQGCLVEHFAYSTAVQAMLPRGLNIVPVSSDDEGMQADGPGALADVLENWDPARGKRPHLLYTVTMGQNPTSALPSLQRRRDLYALASKYDVIIVEDDPYWCLQFPASIKRMGKTSGSDQRPQSWKSSGYDFIDSLVPSSLNIDTDGRVIRLETFSKIIAPGCRVGWMAGQPALIERILRLQEVSTAQPSGFVCALVAEMILGAAKPPPSASRSTRGEDDKGWQMDGCVRWIEGIRGNYERRMITMCNILDHGRELVKSGRRHSLSEALAATSLDADSADEWAVVEKKQMYSFDWPLAGMFVWLQVHFENHPLWRKVESARLSRALWIFLTTKPFAILIAPGGIFAPTQEIMKAEGWRFFRVTFAAADEDQLPDISQRLVDGIQAFWRVKTVAAVDDILKDDDMEEPSGFEGLENMGQLSAGCF